MHSTLLRRLLYLFPVVLLRRFFDVGGSGRDGVVSNVMRKAGADDIIRFIHEHFGFAKQHVYILEIPRGRGIPNMICGVPQEQISSSQGEALYMVDVSYSYVAEDLEDEKNIERDDLDFKWPVKLSIEHNCLVVKMIIMEKKVDAYLPDNLNVIQVYRNVEDIDILDNIGSQIVGHKLDRVDLDRGIKTSWQRENYIDSPSLSYLKAHSVSREDMHPDHYVKSSEPEAYRAALDQPMLKTVFHCMRDGMDIPEVFVVDPVAGFLAFTRYNESRDKIGTLIDEILRNN